MRIVIEAGCLENMRNQEEKQYVTTLFQNLAASQPNHFFTIITKGDQPFTLPNVSYLSVFPAKNYIGFRRWYSHRLPVLLQQANAGALIVLNGCPAKTPVPQVVFISSVAAVWQSFSGSLLFLYKKYWIKELRTAGNICVITEPQYRQLMEQFNINADRVVPVGYAVPAAFQTVSWQRREEMLQSQTNGKEYFLYTGSFSETYFLQVLKAFSLFKKRQQSGMQLIAAGWFTVSKNLQEKLDTYKYRTDVILHQTAGAGMMAMLMAGAYTIIFADEHAPVAFSVAAAMQCGVPVVAPEKSRAANGAAGNAALYAGSTPESLAEQMKIIYKDENLRQQLVANANQQAAMVNGTLAAKNLWDGITNIAAKNPATFVAL